MSDEENHNYYLNRDLSVSPMSTLLSTQEESCSSSSPKNRRARKSKKPTVVAVPKRARGRPRGNPPKLGIEQRRKRNAELEKERRVEMGQAYRELQETYFFVAFGRDPQKEDDDIVTMTRSKLLEKTTDYITSCGTTKQELEEQNRAIRNEIKQLKRQLKGIR